VRSYSPLLDRARREALLRMKAQAAALSADMIINVRLETSSIGVGETNRKGLSSVEMLAYGTAVRLQR
jgi:uncharacterized protein YbjQ (UPF0145 family)